MQPPPDQPALDRCPICRYDLTGFLVGQRCPECGAVIRSPGRSPRAATLLALARIFAWCGVACYALNLLCVASPLLLLALPSAIALLITGHTLAWAARSELRTCQAYDERARDALRVPFYALPIGLSIVLLFVGVEILLAFTQSLGR